MEVVEKKFTNTAAGTPAATEPGLSQHLRGRIAREFRDRYEKEWGKRFVTHGSPPGAGAVRLDGNDYLAVTGHEDIVNAQIAALRNQKDFVVQSGVFQLDCSSHHRFETALAAFVGKQTALLCQSGYTANLGLIQVIADAETPVYVDSLAHMSLWEGVRAAGAPATPFRHNDPEHLARMAARGGPGLVIVDSVYSTTGALCPLERMVEVAEQNGCMILVDESHSLGTHGPQGRGLCAELGLTNRVHFITASLAKAFAGRAGFFTMPEELRHYLMCHSYPSIFSSCLLPQEIAGLHATLGVIQRSDSERQALRSNTKRLRARLVELGYPIQHGSEQIISMEAGPEVETLALRDELESRSVYGAVFCAPATARNRSMVRLTLNAGLTDAELSHVEAVAEEIAPIVKPWDWQVARRQRARSDA